MEICGAKALALEGQYARFAHHIVGGGYEDDAIVGWGCGRYGLLFANGR